MSSNGVSPTPSDLINFLKLSRILLEDVPDVLRSLFYQVILKKHAKKWFDNAKWGKWFLQQDRFTSKLKVYQKQMIESGLTQNWDLTLLFHALLYSSHFLLADSIPGQQLSVTHNSNKATTPVKVDLGHHIRPDDCIILDFEGSCFIAKVTIVSLTKIIFKHLSLPPSSHSLNVNAYLCSTMWCAVQDLSFIRNNEFGHRTSARITEKQLLDVVKRIESNYKDLNVEPSRISSLRKILAEPIVESSIAQKVKYYQEKWIKECEHYEHIMECFEKIQTDVAIVKDKEIPEIKKGLSDVQDKLKIDQQKNQEFKEQNDKEISSMKSHHKAIEDEQESHQRQLTSLNEKLTQNSSVMSVFHQKQTNTSARVSDTVQLIKEVSDDKDKKIECLNSKTDALADTVNEMEGNVTELKKSLEQKVSTAHHEMKDQFEARFEQLDERVNIALENQAPSTEPNSGHPIDFVYIPINPGLDKLQDQVDEVMPFIAYQLIHKYDSLFVAVKKSLKQHLLLEDGKDLIELSLKRKAKVHKDLTLCIDALKKTQDFESFFNFLEKYCFIGYLNYILLKKLYELIVCKDEVNKCFVEYETQYAKFLRAISCKELIEIFKQNSEKALTVPLGLPCVTFRFEESASSSFFDCVSKLDEFPWMEFALLKQLQEKCIDITYAILPCVLDDVMKDLNNPMIIKKLKDKGITKIELPQEEEGNVNEPLHGEEDIEFTKATEKSASDCDAAPIVATKKQNNDALRIAIQKNSIDDVTLFLKNGANPNVSEFPFGGPLALFVATKENNIDIVKLLLENGADPNLGCNTFHGTALHYASETNNADMVDLLLTEGKADVNAVDKWNRTPLFVAVESGSIEVVRILLTNGARTDVVDTLNGTPLFYAAGKTDILEVLLAKGNLDVNTVNNYKRTPLFNAVESGSIKAVKSLLKAEAKTDVVDEGGETLLHRAGTSGKVEMLKFLIKKKVTEVNAKDKRNRTPLFNAVESGSSESVKSLLEAKAKTDVVDEDGETLLHCASESGNVEILSLLMDKGVSCINASNRRKRTPLFNAVESGNIKAVKLLMDLGAKIDVVDEVGETLLHCAGKFGNVEMLRFLMNYGVTGINALDKRNRTPLFNAVESGSVEAVKFLIENKGAKTDVVDEDDQTLLHCAGTSGKVKMLGLLIKKGVIDVNALDKRKRTPLFNAVESGSVEAVKFLIEKGAKTDVVDKYDNGLLHCASETGNADIIELLITKGKADVNAVDKDNRTPLFNAVKSGRIKAINILLTNGARTDVEDKLGNTLLKFAAEAGRPHVLELLYSGGHAKMAAASEKFGTIDPSGLSIEKKEIEITKKPKDSVTKGMLQKFSDLALSPESVMSSLRIPKFRNPPKASSVGSGQSKLVKT